MSTDEKPSDEVENLRQQLADLQTERRRGLERELALQGRVSRLTSSSEVATLRARVAELEARLQDAEPAAGELQADNDALRAQLEQAETRLAQADAEMVRHGLLPVS